MDRSSQPRAGIRHPMFFGFLFGLLCGIGIALAVALYVNRITSPFVQQPAVGQSRNSPAAAKPEPSASTGAKATPSPAASAAHESAAGIKPKSAEQAPSGKLFLQVGSFVSETEADNRKAQLALLGLQASVRAASVPDKGTVHRVVLGPYSSMEELDEVKESLKGNGFTSTLVTQ